MCSNMSRGLLLSKLVTVPGFDRHGVLRRLGSFDSGSNDKDQKHGDGEETKSRGCDFDIDFVEGRKINFHCLN